MFGPWTPANDWITAFVRVSRIPIKYHIYVHDEHQKDPNVLSVEVARRLKHTCGPGISIPIRVHTQMVLVRYSTSIEL